MNKQECNILVILDEERNMTRAAKKLYMSQPALTYRLHQLEERFGVRIFTREKSGLILTPQGEIIVQYARQNIIQLEETIEALQLMDRKIRGTIKLGVASTYGQYILPNLINTFINKYPDVDFNIVTGLSSMIADLFTTGEVHIGIFRGEFPWNEEKAMLATEPICLASKGKISIENLPNIPRIEYRMDGYLKQMVDEWWKSKFSTDECLVSMTVDSLETAKELVRTGLGYTILPGICLTNEKELSIQPLTDEHDKIVRRLTWAYCRHQTLQYASVNTFYQFLQSNGNLQLSRAN